jgi:VWFA-related protein
MRWELLTVVLVLIPSSTHVQVPRGFRTSIELVEVDVRVTDGQGRFVPSLGIDDFEIREDGKLQQITGLRLVGTAKPPNHDSSVVAAEPRAVHPWVFVFDDQHMQPSGLRRARMAVEQFVATRSEPMLIGIVFRGRLLNNRVATDRAEILRALAHVRLPGEALDEDDPPFITKLRLERAANHALETVSEVGRQLSRVAGPKTVVLFSDGFPIESIESSLLTVVMQLRSAQVRVYAVDTRGMQGEPASTLNSLAFDTDGLIFFNINNLNTALADIDADTRAYYLLTYSPTNKKVDGKFRRIAVTSPVKGVRLRARHGYFAVAVSR